MSELKASSSCSCPAPIPSDGDCAKCGHSVVVGIAELKHRANEYHHKAVRRFVSGLAASIRSGEALIQIREQLPAGTWLSWVEENFHGTAHTATTYIRFARHKAELAQRNVSTYDEGLHVVREIAAASRPSESERSARLARVRAWRDEGLSLREIGSRLGVDGTTIARWLEPAKLAREPHRVARARETDRVALAKLVERARGKAEAAARRDESLRGVSERLAELALELASPTARSSFTERRQPGVSHQPRSAGPNPSVGTPSREG